MWQIPRSTERISCFGNIFVNFYSHFIVFEGIIPDILTCFAHVDVGNQLKVGPNAMEADDASM